MNILKELMAAETHPTEWTREDTIGIALIGLMAIFLFAAIFTLAKFFLTH